MSVDNLPLWARSHAKSGRLSTLDSVWEARYRPIYIGANESISKFDPDGVLHYAKVFPREMSPLYANSPSSISKLSKTAGQRYVDTPGTVYLEVFVDSPQGGIVLSSSFAGAAVQKTKEPADT